MTTTHMVAVDWGTTHFRAYRIDASGKILDQHQDQFGAAQLKQNQFETHLLSTTRPWRQESTPVLICGMAGSTIGWQDAGYVECPTSLDNLASACLKVSKQFPIWIIPGLKCQAPDSKPDIMRGEETQLLGCLNKLKPIDKKIAILPGTHSKWVSISDGRIETFATAMTGELYTLLTEHSILAIRELQTHSEESFILGLKQADTPALLHQLFSVRALTVLGDLNKTAIASYLSGLLLGTEIKQMLALFENSNTQASPISIIGSNTLTEQYQKALSFYNLQNDCIPGDNAVISGLLKINKQLNKSQ